MFASKFGFVEIVDMLLAAPDVKVDLENNDGSTALHVAARAGHHFVVEKLLDAGADHKKEELNGGRTPLAIAMRRGHKEVHAVIRKREL